MCRKVRWSKSYAIEMAKKWYESIEIHVGVVENEPGDFNFFPLESITVGVKIFYSTKEMEETK